ncbi:MAG: CZB domain-containing protein [Pseudomonadota bacterium]
MGLLDWFKALASGKEVSEPEATGAAQGAPEAADPDAGVVAGLDFKGAINAHMAWKVRLEKCINDTSEEELHVDVVSRDDQCVLGKWIHGPGGERFGHLREFQEMKMEHMRFHLGAGDVLACCQAGDKEGAMDKLRAGDYTRASARVKLHLSRLYVQLTDHPQSLE